MLHEGGRDIAVDVIITTSDARVAEAGGRVGCKIGWLFLWNLPKKASDTLADQLRMKEDRELLWRLAGVARESLGRSRGAGSPNGLITKLAECF